MFLRDFAVQFRQKLLGYVWAFLAPVMAVASFVFLSMVGVLRPGDTDVPYPLFVFVGVGSWGLLLAVLQTVAGGLVQHGDLVMRTSIPRIGLALSGLGTVIYGQVIHVLTLLVLLACFQRMPSWGALLYPLLIVPLIALGIGVGLLLAVIGALARDATSMVTTVLGFVMFLTPVIYVPKFQNPVVQELVLWNPLTHLIDAPRSAFFTGELGSVQGFLWSSCLAFAVLVLGVHGFYLIQERIVERL
ncbi:MAG TPA: ABC transporter permease [Gemmataceae bacterium]|nr:ABC transporter permease [Gemmataceae bacterium]